MDVRKLASEIVVALNIAYGRNLPSPAVETTVLVINEHIAAQQSVKRTAIKRCDFCGIDTFDDEFGRCSICRNRRR